jgi:hypothetical protein
MIRLHCLLCLLSLWLAGCSKTLTPESMEPDAVASGERDAVSQRGKAIAAETVSLLSSNLQSAIQQGGITNALPFCSLAASPLTAGLAAKHGVTLRRVSHKPRNPANQADERELAILNQFHSALDGTNPPPPIVTRFNPDATTFFAPILIGNELCLKCHGEPGRDISPENLAVIRRLYPQDKAFGFRPGGLRGALRIDFPRAPSGGAH